MSRPKVSSTNQRSARTRELHHVDQLQRELLNESARPRTLRMPGPLGPLRTVSRSKGTC